MTRTEKIIASIITAILGAASIVFLTLIILEAAGIETISFVGEAGYYSGLMGFAFSFLGFVVSLIVTLRN